MEVCYCDVLCNHSTAASRQELRYRHEAFGVTMALQAGESTFCRLSHVSHMKTNLCCIEQLTHFISTELDG